MGAALTVMESIILSAGISCLISILITSELIYEHLAYNQNEQIKKYIIRILGMVPIYCIESWFGLKYPEVSIYFEVIRDMYEAFVLYSFFQFLVCYLGGEDSLAITLASKSHHDHVFPFNYCCRSWIMGPDFIRMNKIGTLQYVFIKPIMALLTFILESESKYGDGEFSAVVGYPYIAFVNNCSQIWALYCLVLFFLATKEELEPISPLPKFLCIKAIVFFTFWQSVVVAILVKSGLIESWEGLSASNVSSSIQDFIICIEMLGFAFLHQYAFPVSDFQDEPEVRRRVSGPLLSHLLHITNPLDIVEDMRDVVRNKSNRHYQSIGVSETQLVSTANSRLLTEGQETDGI